MTTAQKAKPAYPIGPDYEEQKAEWTAYLDEMVDSVKKGYFDDILKEMARAIFDRRDIMQGKQPGTSFRDRADGTDPGSAGRTAGTPSVAPQPAAGIVMPQQGKEQWEVYDGEGAFVGRIPASLEQRGVAQFQVNGKTYMRNHLINKVIRMPMNVNPSYVRNIRVKVIGVGGKSVKVEWVDLPKAGSKYRQQADAGKPCFVPLSTLSNILG